MSASHEFSGFCPSLVRAHDADRFLIAMFFPQETRRYLWPLYAFNHEIAKTREVVTDTKIGLIRLQWWRDAITAIYERNEVADHDIVRNLTEIIDRYDLPRNLFEQMIYAREFDLEDRLPGSLDGLCNYASFTHAPLLQTGSLITGAAMDAPSLEPVGMAYSLAGLLRAVPGHTAQGRCYLPEDLLRREGIIWKTLEQERHPKKIIPVVRAVRERAEDLLRQSSLKQEGRLVGLHRALTQFYLTRLKRAGDNPYHKSFRKPLFGKEIYLWMASKRL